MSEPWCVLLDLGADSVVYGPMNAADAEAFAEFMTNTVDPATARPLRSPVREMATWHRNENIRNNCTHAEGCEVHPHAEALHDFDGQ